MPTLVQPAGPQVLITRLINAPRDRVFQAWTDPEQLVQWHAPQGCSIRYKTLDVRTGGEFLSCITTPSGYECWCRGTYREVIRPERIVLTMSVADAEGNLRDPVAAGMDPDWPAETVVTVTFADENGRTRLTLHQSVSEALAIKTGAQPSWLQMFDRLEAQVGR